MYELDKETVKKILVEEMNLPAFDVDLFLRDFPPLHNSFSLPIEQWLKNRTIADLVIEGLTIQEVMEKQQSHFLAAVRDLNILLDEKIPIEKRKSFNEILRTPVRRR
ncbi:MAG: hypothetical protein ABUK01_09780 [Leptospirales bacterium]